MKLWHYLENWFQAEYIFSKFPNYLLSKVKSLNLTHEQKNKILEAVRPKEIGFKICLMEAGLLNKSKEWI